MPSRPSLKLIPGSICAPLGFRAAAIFCDIKTLGTGKGSDTGPKPDLALIVSDVPAAVAGTFTTNRVCAAPVKLSAKHASRRTGRAIVVNSGNANACTGDQGMRDARRMAEVTAESLGSVRNRNAAGRISPNDVLVCSTGRIGVPMPMKNVERGIRGCAALLERNQRNAGAAAHAIMTSDTRRKEVAVEFSINRVPVRLGGIAKGAGMIQPRMRAGGPSGQLHATMLAFVTSDVAIAPDLLKAALPEAVDQSFNRITVDGDMSTNDSVIALANGLAGNRTIVRRGSHFNLFQSALIFVCRELARMIVKDGEGVSRFVTVHVHNARSVTDAEKAARAVANSSLVRTSWCGGDPNWGRILCAVGYSGATMEEGRTDIGYSATGQSRIVYACRAGAPTGVAFQRLTAITGVSEFDVHINLHTGQSEFRLCAADLTEEYVTFNKGDIGDPESLGG